MLEKEELIYRMAASIGNGFEEYNIPYAFGGAIAYTVWGPPRATTDIDIDLFIDGCDRAGLNQVFDILESIGMSISRPEALREAAETDIMTLYWNGVRVEFFTAAGPFNREVEKTRVRRKLGDDFFWFLSAEAITVFKMVFFRPKDIADVERLIKLMGRDLDTEYIREWLVKTVTDGEDSREVEKWDEMIAEHGL